MENVSNLEFAGMMSQGLAFATGMTFLSIFISVPMLKFIHRHTSFKNTKHDFGITLFFPLIPAFLLLAIKVLWK